MFNELQTLSTNLKTYKDSVKNEAQTRVVLIDPFLKLLGYTTSNPTEVEVEYVCDIGTKKGEKIDYALKKDNKVVVLIEAKGSHITLDDSHLNQLIRYYGVSTARIGILTNGLEYRFYADSFRRNVLDTKPFYVFNVLDCTDKDVEVLKLFTKENFNVSSAVNYADSASYKQFLLDFLEIQMQNPTDELLNLMLDTSSVSLNKDKLRNAVTEGLSELLEGFAVVEDAKVNDAKLVTGLDSSNSSTNATPVTNSSATPTNSITAVAPAPYLTLADLERKAQLGRPLSGKPFQITISGRSYNISHWYELVFTACKWLKEEGKFADVMRELKEGNKNAWISETKPVNVKEANYKYNDSLNIYLHINTVSRDMVTRTIRILSLAGVDKANVSVRTKN